jgi:hypothetical protein
MKDLLELAEQYKSDVETRIACIKEDRDNDEAAQNDPMFADPYEDQILHWKTTLKQIDEVLGKYETGKSVDMIAIGYEWICPNCEEYNKEIKITEKVSCTSCNEVCKTNPPEHAHKI